MTRTPHGAAARSMTFRQVLVVLSVASALAAGCEADDDLSSGDLGFIGRERRPCVGAFAPHNEACWRDPGDGGETGEISANSQASQENSADVLGTDRCAQGLVGTPGVRGTLTITFTTVTTHGLYAPRNCGAVWVEKAPPFLDYIRTLELWTKERLMSIVQWDLRACKSDPKLVDATTSATLPDAKTHTSTWDMTDFRGAVVPDGDYVIWLQVAENEVFPEGPFVQIPFSKGPVPQNLTIPDQDGFKGITITYTPQ